MLLLPLHKRHKCWPWNYVAILLTLCFCFYICFTLYSSDTSSVSQNEKNIIARQQAWFSYLTPFYYLFIPSQKIFYTNIHIQVITHLYHTQLIPTLELWMLIRRLYQWIKTQITKLFENKGCYIYIFIRSNDHCIVYQAYE